MADAQNISLDNPGSVGAVVVPVVFALIFLLGTVGNGLVLAVLLQPSPSAWQEPGSTTDLFILNLAVADLCFILCCVPFQAAIYTLDAWLFGALVCKAVHLLIYLTMYASSFTLAAVSVDRYLAVRHPLRSRALRTPRHARAAVGLVWLLAALFSAPYLSYYGTVRYGALELCVPAWEDARRRALDVATFAAGYLLPVAVVSLAYARTLRFLWVAVGPAGAAMAEARRRATGRAGRAMLAVAALYALCWGPHHALILCFWFGRFAFSPATYACRLASHCLAYANSCLNPLVYALASRHFRARLRRLWPCGRRHRHRRARAPPGARRRVRPAACPGDARPRGKLPAGGDRAGDPGEGPARALEAGRQAPSAPGPE
ncbi:galanin receptor type 3 [Mustela nigripes]|uniref:Galanin receptor type 3 n=1 Tax=Mustela putorius furo TaxID=9669 RepID=A0A8U0MJF4_MUSPF|nr:galanin receptor type 3 [Mustela putorius furo]XP_059039635.1 galanin receptor type 3 [Mustela lutreola]XP_059260589.1 galanin receptor type 3 [Mustela nigripes]